MYMLSPVCYVTWGFRFTGSSGYFNVSTIYIGAQGFRLQHTMRKLQPTLCRLQLPQCLNNNPICSHSDTLPFLMLIPNHFFFILLSCSSVWSKMSTSLISSKLNSNWNRLVLMLNRPFKSRWDRRLPKIRNQKRIQRVKNNLLLWQIPTRCRRSVSWPQQDWLLCHFVILL